MLILKSIIIMRGSTRIIISLVLVVVIVGSVLINRDKKIYHDQYRASTDLAECSVTFDTNPAGSSGLESAGFEDYRNPAGIVENDTLRITLEARQAEWQPWGPDGPAIYTHVFAADGQLPRVPGPDSLTFPGSPIILTRAEPTEITVHNQTDVPLGVHWHGLELESWSDGVPGWSGVPGSVIPAVQPGSSFSVRMTPPRSGTFMYHVHSEPGHQLAQGLYGPFLVIDPDEEWNPKTDRYFILGSLGSGDDPPTAVNGEFEPDPMEFTAGETYRLRFMHISPDDNKHVSLLKNGEPVAWQYIAKDGADLPPNQVGIISAELDIHVGETYDFLWMPEESGSYTLNILTTFDQGAPAFPREAPEPHRAEVEVRVGGMR
jgi:FtsP/CotA-like multicopper oxidase with cupredoxin domain